MSISALNGAGGAPHAHRAHHGQGAKGASNDQDQTATSTATTPNPEDPYADPDYITSLLSPVTSSSTAVQSALNLLKPGGI